MSKQAGKGPRIPGVNTKALRAGYEAINWSKKPSNSPTKANKPQNSPQIAPKGE